MKKSLLLLFLSLVSIAFSQQITDRRSASIRGGGGEGKCTIEVWVDDVAEVEIRGAEAAIRTVNGNPATFRRFECNQSMPIRPADFRFRGIDGRGRQQLLSSASDNGRAIIRIEDSKGGAEGYTFDIFWSGTGGGFRPGNNGGFGNNGGGFGNGGGNNGSIFGGGNNNGGGWNNGNNGNNGGWNNGWGNGGGWNNNPTFNFEGGRRGSGSYRDRNGQIRRLDAARVVIDNSGNLSVTFQSDRGNIQFDGIIDRRQGRRVFSQIRNSELSGTLEVEMGSQRSVNRITLRQIDLNWSN